MSQIVSAVPLDTAQQEEDVVSVGNESPGCHKLLRMPRRLEALHATLSLSGRLMGVLCAVVQVPALPMDYSRQNDFPGGPIAAKFVGDDHAGRPAGGAQQLAKEAHSGKSIALRLDQDVNHGAVLVHRTPEIMLYTIDLQEHFIQEHLSPSLGRLRFSLDAYEAPNVSHHRRIVS
jgi:hypothetical protein